MTHCDGMTAKGDNRALIAHWCVVESLANRFDARTRMWAEVNARPQKVNMTQDPDFVSTNSREDRCRPDKTTICIKMITDTDFVLGIN